VGVVVTRGETVRFWKAVCTCCDSVLASVGSGGDGGGGGGGGGGSSKYSCVEFVIHTHRISCAFALHVGLLATE
jgi:hypothetical protein